MKFQGAVLKEQGVTFAIVIVKRHILNQRPEAEGMIRTLQSYFSGIPVVLMAQDSTGRPTYYGRQDIARFLARVPIHAIPWKEYAIH